LILVVLDFGWFPIIKVIIIIMIIIISDVVFFVNVVHK